MQQNEYLSFDVETTTHNKGHPFDKRNFLVSYSLYSPSISANFKYYSDPGFLEELKEKLKTTRLLIGFNIKFDIHWVCRCLGDDSIPVGLSIWDVQLAEFIISGQRTSFDSLNDVLERYGLPIKPDLVKDYWDKGVSTEDIPVDILEEYNNYDAESTYKLFELQKAKMSKAQQRLLIDIGNDLKVLQHAEFAGIKFDREAAELLVAESQVNLESIEIELSKYLPSEFPNEYYTFNWDSGDQLSALLYGGKIDYAYSIQEQTNYRSGSKKGEAYVRNRWFSQTVSFPRKFTPKERTEVSKTRSNPPEGNHFFQVDGPTIQSLKSRRKEDKILLQFLQDRSKIIKVLEMVRSLLKLMDEKQWNDGFLHGQFNQQIARTGRLSSSTPNLQNTPPEIDKLLISRYAY